MANAKTVIYPLRVDLNPPSRTPTVVFGVYTWQSGQYVERGELPVALETQFSADQAGLAVREAAKILRADLLEVAKGLGAIAGERHTAD